MTECPQCSAAVANTDVYCEACGAGLTPEAAITAPHIVGALAAGAAEPDPTDPPTHHHHNNSQECALCGASVLDDGFCESCGAKGRSPRDHWTEHPAPWVGGVCDRGVAHSRNEDAMALAATPDHSLGVLVVCDGVTSAPASDKASLAASRAACAALVATPPADAVGEAGLVAHWTAALERAATDAQAATVAVARSMGDQAEAPSSTFVAAVVVGAVDDPPLAVVGWCGDSRAYWLPDHGGQAEQLTEDHSLGTELVRAGMSRADAERDPAFHTITRWLGADSADPHPQIVARLLEGPGWLLLCSDGLWNYASPPDALADVFAGCAADDLVERCELLVDWANDCGGHDNVTVALARVG